MPTTDPPPDSRRLEGDRAALALDVIFQPHDGPPRMAKLEDLSAGGARIEATKPCKTGEVVVLHLPWPSQDEPSSINAVVRWVDGQRMGVQFSMATASEGEAISALRRSAQRKASAETARKALSRDAESLFSRDALLAVAPGAQGMGRRVRFQEVDAAGTIYYSRVFEYFGDAYIDLLERGGVSLPSAMANRSWVAPLVHAEAEYLAPMRFGDSVVVSVVTVRCGTSAATVGYRIASPEGRPLAVGHTVHVFVDSTTFRPCPIPADVRRALEADAG